MRRPKHWHSHSPLQDSRPLVRPILLSAFFFSEDTGRVGGKAYTVHKITLRAPIHSVLRASSVPGQRSNAVLAAVEVRGCEHVVFEDLVVDVARAGGHWRRGHCDDGRGDFCESCACDEDEREARWEEMHREAGDVYKV